MLVVSNQFSRKWKRTKCSRLYFVAFNLYRSLQITVFVLICIFWKLMRSFLMDACIEQNLSKKEIVLIYILMFIPLSISNILLNWQTWLFFFLWFVHSTSIWLKEGKYRYINIFSNQAASYTDISEYLQCFNYFERILEKIIKYIVLYFSINTLRKSDI